MGRDSRQRPKNCCLMVQSDSERSEMKATVSYYKYSLSLILSQGKNRSKPRRTIEAIRIFGEREMSHQQRNALFLMTGKEPSWNTLLKGFPGPKKRLKSEKKNQKNIRRPGKQERTSHPSFAGNPGRVWLLASSLHDRSGPLFGHIRDGGLQRGNLL